MIGVRDLRDGFADFDFDWMQDGEIVGFAPPGGTGIVEIAERDGATQVSLLVSSRIDRSTKSSTDYVARLAEVTAVNFRAWISEEIARRGNDMPWDATRCFGTSRVSLWFHPTDSLVITYTVPSHSRS